MGDQSNSLQALLSSKAALDLGLITQDDFDQVKSSFLKAQQIKAAVDVGLITSEAAAKDEFLNTLSSNGTPSANGGSAPAPRAAPPKPAPPVVHQRSAPPPAPVAAAAAPKAAAPPPPVAPPPPPVAAAPPPQPASQPPSRPASSTSLARTGSNPDVPSNIPKMGGLKTMQGGVRCIIIIIGAVQTFFKCRKKSNRHSF